MERCLVMELGKVRSEKGVTVPVLTKLRSQHVLSSHFLCSGPFFGKLCWKLAQVGFLEAAYRPLPFVRENRKVIL
jgi:hypothetical protein